MAKELAGIFAPITTPFENEDVSINQFKENIAKYADSSLNGLFVLGSNGENKSLTEDEKISLLEAALEGKSENQLLLAGTGYESTQQTIRFSRKVARMGVDFVSVVTPSYFKKRMTDEVLVAFFTDVAEAVEVPIIVYNAPGFTGITISPKVIEELASHPNIAGMKDSTGGNPAGYIQAANGADFKILAGTISTLFNAMTLGAAGGVVSLANAFPEPPCRLYQKLAQGDLAGALPLHNSLYALNKAVSGSFGVAGVKYAMELGGFNGGDPRKPLLPISDAGKQSIKAAVEASGLF